MNECAFAPMRLIKLRLATGLVLLGLALAACGSTLPPTPTGPPGPGPSWQPQEAIHAVGYTTESVAISHLQKDVAWNAEFDPYAGRWKVTAIYKVQNLYPPSVERNSIYWYVYEDTSLVEGPLD